MTEETDREQPDSIIATSSGSSVVPNASTAAGAKRIFARFVAVALGVNALVGLGVVIYNVHSSLDDTVEKLERQGAGLGAMVRRLRDEMLAAKHGATHPSEGAIVARIARLSDTPMALISPSGEISHPTDPLIREKVRLVYEDGRVRDSRVVIREDLGLLSGAWIVDRFCPTHRLLLIVRRLPSDEGVALYMTISAGIAGLGVALGFLLMLAAANWMLRRPLSRLVHQLTSALEQDIERRRHAEARALDAKREAEEHLAFMNSLIDASDVVGILAVDKQQRVQIFNVAASRILGYETSEVVGLLELDALRGKPRANTTTVAGRELPMPQSGEEVWCDRAGEDHLLTVNSGPIVDGKGELKGELLIFVDVTERRRLEAELQLNELQLIQSAKLATLGEMATGMAHELNQPLNNIGLLSSRMQRKLAELELDEALRQFFSDKLEKINGQVSRAGTIIDHLREFGRPKAETVSSVHVHRPVTGVMVFLQEQLLRHGIEVVTDAPEDLPPVMADEARLEQVLMNLLLNARDALEEAGATEKPKRIEVRARETEIPGGGDGVRIDVADNGPGIPNELIDRIFEPFFSTKDVGKGTGLGLSISYGLVRGFGGILSVVSPPGQGATFSIFLGRARRQGGGLQG